MDCCREDQDGNQDEYQIPNVHPAILAPVAFKGTEEVEIDPDQGDPYFVKADVWAWSFLLEKFFALTTNSSDGSAALLRWVVELEGQQYNNTYLSTLRRAQRAQPRTARAQPHTAHTPNPSRLHRAIRQSNRFL